MFPRSMQLALLASTSALACVASTKCLPEVYAKRFTLVKGNADAAMVQEYAKATDGCVELSIDSIVRRSVDPDTLRIAKNWVDGPGPRSPAVTIYGTYSVAVTAAPTACSKVTTIRRVDSIPRVNTPIVLPGSDLSGETPVPVDPDSVYVCLNGSCSKIVPRVVENAIDQMNCLVGIATPLTTPEAALDYLKERIKVASSVSRLGRIKIAYQRIDCLSSALDHSARAMSLVPVQVKETRLGYTYWNNLGLPALRDWTDTTISKRLALPSSGNAGDFYAPETLLFSRTWPFDPTDAAALFQYPTGIEHYLYAGNMLPAYSNCSDAAIAPMPVPNIVGDTLRLEGLSLNINTGSECGVRGIDIYAGKYDTWLFAPSSEETLLKDFFHGANAETQFSWPIVNDTVLVRSQKVPMAWLQSFVSTLPRPEERRFTARMLDGALSVTLEQPSKLRISGLDGRILSTTEAPAGRSTIVLPRGHRGILLVSAGSRTVRVPAP